MRIAVVADSHLAPDADAFNRNWRAVREYVAALGADLTVHLGDVTLDGVGDPAQLDHARALGADWPTPIRYVPGNHDIGDNPPGPGVAAKHPLEPARIGAFRAALGPDYWALDADGWRVLALNAQLVGTATREEADQWSWLEAMTAPARGRPVALLLHKPLFQDSPLDETPHHRYVPLAPRRRLLELLSGVALHAVLSGHTHQYRDRTVEGVRHVWLPSTAFYLPDELQERLGEKVTGLGVLDLTPDRLRFHLVCPEGVVRNSALDHPVYPELVRARPAAR
jgi:3',5'-cyclic AMP phosphodiesterase CpdA